MTQWVKCLLHKHKDLSGSQWCVSLNLTLEGWGKKSAGTGKSLGVSPGHQMSPGVIETV